MKKHHAHVAAWILASTLGSAVHSAEPVAGELVSFRACPVARDTGAGNDLCFLAEHQGKLYALTNPPDWGVPQLRHRVLVEGRVTGAPAICGAIAIEGRASVLPEIDDSCNTLLPFDGVIKGSPGGVFNSGNPQQRAYAEDLARRAALDPGLSVVPAIPDPAPPPVPTPPYVARTLEIAYPFDSDRGSGPDMVKLVEFVKFAQLAKARKVAVTGYFATSRLADGSQMQEKPAIAKLRAEKVAGIMARLGVNPRSLQVTWQETAIEGRGDGDWRNRKAVVTVTP